MALSQHAGYSDNTRATANTGQRCFGRFMKDIRFNGKRISCYFRGGGPFSDAIFIMFITWMLTICCYKYNTIKTYLWAAGALSTQFGFENPALRTLVRRCSRGAKWISAKLGRVRRKFPISVPRLRAWGLRLPNTHDAMVMWCAALLAFYCLLRVSEYAIDARGKYNGLRLGDLTFKLGPNGSPISFTAHLPRSKTDKWRYGHFFTVQRFDGAMDLVGPLYELVKDDPRSSTAPLFQLSNGKTLNRRLVDRYAKDIINDERYTEDTSTHSFRVGGGCAMWEAGFSEAEIRLRGRWASNVWMQYVVQSTERDGNVAQRMSGTSDDPVVFATNAKKAFALSRAEGPVSPPPTIVTPGMRQALA